MGMKITCLRLEMRLLRASSWEASGFVAVCWALLQNSHGLGYMSGSTWDEYCHGSAHPKVYACAEESVGSFA